MNIAHRTEVTIVGGGFTGLAAAYELARHGVQVAVVECEAEPGGLASAFDVGGERLDRFYHHWFTSDREIMDLIGELGLTDRVQVSPTNTGIFYANSFFRLSTPWDLLKFKPLGLADRLRLGLLALRARRVGDWQQLESLSAREWLIALGGENVFRVVWEPLLKGKFGPHADDVSAVWFWNKLKLRGGSRGRGGEERLAYLRGGFVALADALVAQIRALGGRVDLGARVERIHPENGTWHAFTSIGTIASRRVIATPALPLVARLISDWAPPSYLEQLRAIRYIGNVCMVLVLDRPLSQTYWLNVNDPSFPFVGVIEHTNFERPESYGGQHIVYLSKYLPTDDLLYALDADAFLDYALPYLRRMFPTLQRSWVRQHHLWRAEWSQPVVVKHYGRLIPPTDGPEEGFHLASMAQIYPEDRGTNYAVREGRKVGRHVFTRLQQHGR
jgi:protoporphyrinogen oxidase